MRTIIIFLLIFCSPMMAQKVDHSLLTELMVKYNYSGNVDYKGLTSEPKLDQYLKILSNTNPEKLISDNEKIAFWINAYNAFTIKAIVDNYPVESINDLHKGGRILGHILSTTVWDNDFIKINGEEYSLNDIEHKILRRDFNEPRIHFAIVCASISCPVLRREAFVADKLDSQLEEQAVSFFSDPSKNNFDKRNRNAFISKILDWFSEDFGNSDEEILLYTSNFLGKDLSDDIKGNLEEWSIEYLDYDWGLNDQKIN